ncbi:Protein angel 1 [Homalodisca vitripennis]|nr:Protein angel 1 [Homalodisca vitripennis]
MRVCLMKINYPSGYTRCSNLRKNYIFVILNSPVLKNVELDTNGSGKSARCPGEWVGEVLYAHARAFVASPTSAKDRSSRIAQQTVADATNVAPRHSNISGVRYAEFTRRPVAQDSPCISFKVVSYNVLADFCMRRYISQYQHSPPETFNWSFRRNTIVNELKAEQPDGVLKQRPPDIVFLRGVLTAEIDSTELLSRVNLRCSRPSRSRDLFERWHHSTQYAFNSTLPRLHRLGNSLPRGYHCMYMARGKERVDGCAVLIKSSVFHVERFVTVELKCHEFPLLRYPNVGIILQLGVKNYPGHYIVVANTHLLPTPSGDNIRICQLALFIAEIDKVACYAHNKYYPVILAGDLNSRSDSHVISLLRNGSVHCAYTWTDERSNETLSVPVGVLGKYAGILHTCQYAGVVANRARRLEESRRAQNTTQDRRSTPKTQRPIVPAFPLEGHCLMSISEVPRALFTATDSRLGGLETLKVDFDHVAIIRIKL